MSKVAIILPCYNSGEHLEPAIRSIVNNTKYPFKLILSVSESTDGTVEVCKKWAKIKEADIEVIISPKEGITKAINKAIKYAQENIKELDGVYLTQDDVILPNLYGRDWLTELVRISKYEDCGIVTTIYGGGVSGDDYINNFNWVGTWSLFISLKTLNTVGLLDENFSPGPGDDIDYTYRIIKEKKRIYIADFWVDHHRLTENFNDKIEFQKKKNAGYFRQKHGFDPYWLEFQFDGKKYLLHYKTREIGGCFNASKEVDSPDTIRFIREKSKEFSKDDIFIDIGAHTGLFSLSLENGTAYCFEPTESTFEILKTNVAINPGNYIIFNEALSDGMHKYKMNINDANSGGNSLILGEGEKQTVTLDSFNIEKPIKIIKIDCEGHDQNVVNGLKKTLYKHKPILITEQPIEVEGYEKIADIDNNHVYKPK